MSIFRRLEDWYWRWKDRGELRVSRACVAHHERHMLTRGVDLPRWRTPREVAQLRRQERRAALRVVNGRGA